MKRCAVTVGLLLLLGNAAVARQNPGRGSYSVSGLLISENSHFDSQFEIRLLTDMEREVGAVVKHTQERFLFSGLERGLYYIVANVSGHKPVRHRVEFVGNDREASVSIVLEPEPIVVTKATGVTSVSRMARPGAVLKELEAANKKLAEGSIEEARTRLESIVNEAPDFYDAHRSLAIAYQSERRYRDAEKEYRIAQTLEPALPGPWMGLASNYLEQLEAGGEPSSEGEAVRGALEAARHAVKADPGVALAHYLLGVAYYRSSLLDEAAGSLSEALQRDCTLGPAHLALVNVYIRLQQWERALAQIDFYIKENPRARNRDEVLTKRSEIERMIDG
jgi:Tfp pilus assembly protein PilF